MGPVPLRFDLPKINKNIFQEYDYLYFRPRSSQRLQHEPHGEGSRPVCTLTTLKDGHGHESSTLSKFHKFVSPRSSYDDNVSHHDPSDVASGRTQLTHGADNR